MREEKDYELWGNHDARHVMLTISGIDIPEFTKLTEFTAGDNEAISRLLVYARKLEYSAGLHLSEAVALMFMNGHGCN